MNVETARYRGLDLRFTPPIDTGHYDSVVFPLSWLITMAIKGPNTSPDIIASEVPTAQAALNQADATINSLEAMDGGLDADLAADIRLNVIAAYLGGKIAVELAISDEADSQTILAA